MRPSTATRPASIQDSISRREPRPAAASSFSSLSPRGSTAVLAGLTAAFAGSAAALAGLAAGSGAGFRFFRSFGGFVADFRFGGRGLGGGGGFNLEGLGDFFERRQLLQRAQAQVVQELAGGGVKRKAGPRLPPGRRGGPAPGFPGPG